MWTFIGLIWLSIGISLGLNNIAKSIREHGTNKGN